MFGVIFTISKMTAMHVSELFPTSLKGSKQDFEANS